MQFSLWNFVRYNVFGGGDSALYGVEGPSFYMRNGLNNLNFVLPLGLVYPLVALLDLFQVTGVPSHTCAYIVHLRRCIQNALYVGFFPLSASHAVRC